MRFSFWTTVWSQVGVTSARTRQWAGGTLLLLTLALPGTEASADTVGCAVTSVGFAVEGGLARFTVTVGCGQDGTPVPVDTDLVAGLTVYGEQLVEDDVVKPDPAEWPPNPGGAERILVNDDFFDRHDIEAQNLRLSREMNEVVLRFTTPAEFVASRPYLLFALWKADAKEACDRTDAYARQGCKDFGYTIGWSLHEALVLAYPGITLVTISASEAVAPYDVERWIVERFK